MARMRVLKSSWPLFVAVLLVLCSSRPTHAAVHLFNGEPFEDDFLGGWEGMRASTVPTDHWHHGSTVADGQSYIRLSNMRFTRPAAFAARFSPDVDKTSRVQTLIYEQGDVDKIGYVVDGNRVFCCTADLAVEASCEPGAVIIMRNGPLVYTTYFDGNETEAIADDRLVPITRDGMYFLWFVNCNEAPTTMALSGKAVFKNPTGYLPGMMAPHLPFFGALSLIFCFLGLGWLLASLIFWRDLILLQAVIAAVIGLCVIESVSWYFDYVAFNATGFRPYAVTVWAVLASTLRKAVGRVLVLIVSMGYGVVKPTLGGLTGKVLLLGAAFFAANAALDVERNVGAINDLTTGEELFLVVPVAVLDAITVTWSLHALAATLQQLQLRRNAPKLALYQRFALALVVFVAATLAWMGYEYWFRLTAQMVPQWKSFWVVDDFWYLLNLALLLVICALWRPSANAQRFAYSRQDDDDDVGADADGASTGVTTEGGVTQRTGLLTSHNAGGPNGAEAAERGERRAGDGGGGQVEMTAPGRGPVGQGHPGGGHHALPPVGQGLSHGLSQGLSQGQSHGLGLPTSRPPGGAGPPAGAARAAESREAEKARLLQSLDEEPAKLD